VHSRNPFPLIGNAAYRQHAIGALSHGTGNVHKKFGKDGAYGFRDILADRQTHTQTYSSQYFATAPVGEVITDLCIRWLSDIKKLCHQWQHRLITHLLFHQQLH